MTDLADSMNGRAILRRIARPALAAAIGAVVLVALRLTGSLADTSATLEVMGFDPERARLITDLTAAASIVALATLATRAAVAATVVGIVAGWALYIRQFLGETHAALLAAGGEGTFDPGGWTLTLVTLVVAFAIVASASAALARIVRRNLLAGWEAAAAFVRSDRTWGRAARPAATLLAVVLVAASVPVFGDMVNFAPDVHMRSGRAGLIGLAQTNSQTAPVAGASPPARVVTEPTVLPGARAAPSRPVLVAGRPWSAWQPSGAGTVISTQMPAPWTGGTSSQATIDVYLPPGYGASSRRYPVTYELPGTLAGGWTSGMHVTGILDSLIDSGVLPASIVVFVGMSGGPYPSSECVDSADHRQWLERYLTDTVVSYVDATYRTIATTAARSLLGFSQGGFCSAMAAIRHPDVFSTAISISGYFQAGIHSSETPNAWRPFGGNAAAEQSYSPLVIARTLPSTARSQLFFELSARPDETFFGSQYAAFSAALHAAGVSVSLFPSPDGHSWQEVREELPALLETLAQRETALGVFG